MRFWLKTTRPNVGLWKSLPLGPLGLILGVMLIHSAFFGGLSKETLTVSASAGSAVFDSSGELAIISLTADSQVYVAQDQDSVKVAPATLVLADKSSLLASPGSTKLARRR